MRVKDAVGRFGEEVAAQHLAATGLTILARNWRCREGELDIIATDGDDLVVVEVKTRSSSAFGSPAEAVGRVKAARIRQLTLQWIDETRETRVYWPVIRFDVITVVRHRRGGVEVTHLRDAF